MNSTGVVLEEPISSELVLVDEELALRARGALPDPPWLLPVLAEVEEAARAEPAVVVEERPAPAAVAEAPPARRSLTSRIPAAVVVVFLLFAVALLVYSFLPSPQGPTLAAREPQRTVPLKPPSTTGAAGDSHRARSAPKPRRAAKPKSKAQAKPKPRAVTTPPKAKAGAESRQKPKPRAIASGQRVFAWRRYPGAVYYQFYFQRGLRTIFQARTVHPRAALPASLKVAPGAYRVIVRPAIPGDAGIILGAAIVTRTVRV